MKILHITPSYKPAYTYGGPIYSIAALVEGLVNAGHQVDVFTTTANGKRELSEGIQEVEGVKVAYFRRITKDHTHFSPQLLIHLWRNVKNYDSVHIHAWWNLVSVLAALVCLIRGIRPVFSPRGMLSSYSHSNSNSIFKRLIHSLLGRFLLKRVVFHVTSEQEEKEISNLVGGARHIKTIHNLVNNNFSRENRDALIRSNGSSGSFKLLFLSRIHQKKGIERLLEALSRLHVPFSLTIVGEGDSQYLGLLKYKATELQIGEKISWRSAVVGKEKYEIFGTHDLFILPSYNENFANVVIESLSVGTPVIVSDQVGLADFVREHDLGWICETESQSLAESIEKAFNDIEKRRRINSVAPQIISSQFSAEVLTEAYLNLYKQAARS